MEHFALGAKPYIKRLNLANLATSNRHLECRPMVLGIVLSYRDSVITHFQGKNRSIEK